MKRWVIFETGNDFMIVFVLSGFESLIFDFLWFSLPYPELWYNSSKKLFLG